MMGKYLDLYDVTAGNPVAEMELAEMQDRIAALEAALREAIDYADEMEATDGDPRWTNPDLMAALRASLNQDQPTPDHT